MASVFRIQNYEPKSSESYFLDTNIWIYLFCPIANSKRHEQNIYSNFFKLLTQSDHMIFVSSLILSEFANRYLRIDFDLWKKSTSNYSADYKRDFVGSNHFLNTVSDVKQALKMILTKSERATDDFNAINLDNVLSEFGKSDFNDSYYLTLAKSKKWKIVTHDADFFKDNSRDVDIITANISKT